MIGLDEKADKKVWFVNKSELIADVEWAES